MLNKYYGVVHYSVIIFLLVFFSPESNAASKALVRFTYKFHSDFSLPKYQEAFQQRLSTELNLICHTDTTIKFQFRPEHPSETIKRVNNIFQNRATLCPAGNKNLAQIDELTSLQSQISSFSGDRFILFASESTVRVESSLGHIAILYQDPENLFFSPAIMFSADSFYSLEEEQSSIAYYLKGGLSHLNGRFSVNYFFDHYHDLAKRDKREIQKYKILDSNPGHIKHFDKHIIENLGKTQPYNFFYKNCSTNLLNLLLEAKEEKLRVSGFEPPAKHIDQLIKHGHLEYESTLSSKFENHEFSYIDQNYLKHSTRYPSDLSLQSDFKRSIIEFTAIKFSQPSSGMETRYYDSKIAGLTLFPDQSRVGIELIEKNVINDYSDNRASSFLNIEYVNSLNAHYYGGIGLFRSGSGVAINVGCDIKRGCGILTAIALHTRKHEIVATLKSDNEGNLFKLNYRIKINSRFNTFLRYELDSTWIGGGVRF
jgi:hypothetical protein